jgi:hypothetical protein
MVPGDISQSESFEIFLHFFISTNETGLIKLFNSSLMLRTNKLERLYLRNSYCPGQYMPVKPSSSKRQCCKKVFFVTDGNAWCYVHLYFLDFTYKRTSWFE